MNKLVISCLAAILLLLQPDLLGQSRGLLRQHPDNPHYFLFRGAPTVIIGSGEHYGAVINLDFDYNKYLDTLHRDDLNVTRIFTGAYVEPQGAFRITRNTLAPHSSRFIAPWPRSPDAGSGDEAYKFDLTRFSDEYFRRLKDFVSKAAARDIIVEVTLFCPFYRDEYWELSPMHPRNNVNNLGPADRTHVYTLDKHNGLLPIQMAMVRKIVQELNEFQNVYYEICNEPYFGGVTSEWQKKIVDVIVETEQSLGQKHLISENVANARTENVTRGEVKVRELLHPAIGILNFHYATPPIAVALNYDLDRVIGDNETGFSGTGDEPYRREAWEFILAGGALFNHLDYSFAVGYEDGTFQYPDTQPGGGSPELRRQFKILKDFIESFAFVRMKPQDRVIRRGVPRTARAYTLAEPGRQYAVYFLGPEKANLEITIPPGMYRAEWIDPVNGKRLASERVDVREETVLFSSPPHSGEIALSIIRQSGE